MDARSTLATILLLGALELFVLSSLPFFGLVLPIVLIFVSINLFKLDEFGLIAGVLINGLVRDVWLTDKPSSILIPWSLLAILIYSIFSIQKLQKFFKISPLLFLLTVIAVTALPIDVFIASLPVLTWMTHLIALMIFSMISLQTIKGLERLLGKVI